jgi:hypothetical protein
VRIGAAYKAELEWIDAQFFLQLEAVLEGRKNVVTALAVFTSEEASN